MPTDKGTKLEPQLDQFPSVDLFLHRPLMTDPPMCTLKELQDGTYSLYDVALMHQIADFKIYITRGL